MIKVGIVGGAGYTGGELLRILSNHPWVNIRFVHSQSQAGKAISAVHRDLIGEVNLTFTGTVSQDVDVLFLCMGHGQSAKFVQERPLSSHLKIIDLSQDFRWTTAAGDFVYGLPEAFKEEIKKARNIANPGCFATAIELAMLPLAAHGLLQHDVHVTAITGSTGAGQELTNTTHFSWRNNNVSVYKPFRHQHLVEIQKTWQAVGRGFNRAIHFVPLRGNFTRGILAAVYTRLEKRLAEIKELYQSYFAPHPFVMLVEQNPDVKQVVNTNKALLHLVKEDDQLLVVSVIDNLLKGAVGQAVQNMNLMFGFDETLGLHLKPSAF